MLNTNWLDGWRAHRRRMQMQRPRRGGHRFFAGWAAECLEARTLLSNIAVTAADGIIRLSGDTGNHTVDASVVSGSLHLVGSSGTTFTFNGTTNATVDIPLTGIGVIKQIEISMQGGDDAINFDAAGLRTISGNFVANLGDGTNSLVVKDATVTGRVDVDGGSGADSVQLTNDTLGSLSVHTGAGNDVVHLSTITLQASAGSAADGSLVVDTGTGNDTITFETVTGASSSRDGDWKIRLGSGNDTATLNTVQTHGETVVRGGRGNDNVTTNTSTFGDSARVKLAGGEGQINVNTSTFDRRTYFRIGQGAAQSISVDGSTFQSTARFAVLGANAKLNVESTGSAGVATTFHGRVIARLPGPSGTVNLASPSSTDKLVFDSFVTIVGGVPNATVNVATANTTIGNNKLRLFRATRHDV